MAKDRDGNLYEVGVIINPKTERRMVGIHANGVWLSPGRAKAFARRVVSTAQRVEVANTRKRQK